MESHSDFQKEKLIWLRIEWRVIKYRSSREKHELDCEGPDKQGLFVWLLIRVMSKLAYFERVTHCKISMEAEGGKSVRKV